MEQNHDEIQRSLGRIEGKLDGALLHLEKINGRLDKHGSRLDLFDANMTEVKTKATIYGGIAGTAVMVAWQFIKDKIKL